MGGGGTRLVPGRRQGQACFSGTRVQLQHGCYSFHKPGTHLPTACRPESTLQEQQQTVSLRKLAHPACRHTGQQQVCGPPALLHLTSLGWSSCSSSAHCDCWGCSWLGPSYTEIPKDQELCLWVLARTPTPHPYTYQFLAPTKCLVNMGWMEDG